MNDEGSTFEDWAHWFGYQMIRGNNHVACGYGRDENDVYKIILLYDISTVDNKMKFVWSNPLSFNLG